MTYKLRTRILPAGRVTRFLTFFPRLIVFLPGTSPLVRQTQPVTVHLWRPAAAIEGLQWYDLMLLVGNLEGNNCGAATPCSVPSELGPRRITISVDTGDRQVPRWLVSSPDAAVWATTSVNATAGKLEVELELPLAGSIVLVLTAITAAI